MQRKPIAHGAERTVIVLGPWQWLKSDDGMKRYWGTPVDLDELRVVPPPSWWARALKWAIPLLILGAFAHGIAANQGRLFAQMAYAWILPTSISAAVMTAVAGGKLLSIIAALVGAPFTTLHPLIGAGMVVGLVEAWLRKPTVEDAERINHDVESLRGIYRNRFTRVLPRRPHAQSVPKVDQAQVGRKHIRISVAYRESIDVPFCRLAELGDPSQHKLAVSHRMGGAKLRYDRAASDPGASKRHCWSQAKPGPQLL